jgi:hypothetical protein
VVLEFYAGVRVFIAYLILNGNILVVCLGTTPLLNTCFYVATIVRRCASLVLLTANSVATYVRQSF